MVRFCSNINQSIYLLYISCLFARGIKHFMFQSYSATIGEMTAK